MKLSELKKICNYSYIAKSGECLNLDGEFSLEELEACIKFMKEYKDGDEKL